MMNSKYLDMLKINEAVPGELYNFTKSALDTYGDDIKLAKAEKVCDVLLKYLENKGIYVQGQKQTVVDVLISAALEHNLFYDYDNDKDNWEKLFFARKKLYNIGIEAQVQDEILNAIFSAIECQLGTQTPVNNLRPQMGTPTESFATAVWIVNEVL